MQVTTDTEQFILRATEIGQVMAHQCVRLPTMVLLLGVPKQAAMDDLLVALAKCSEFSHIKLRRGEKKVRVSGCSHCLQNGIAYLAVASVFSIRC
jgi:hypothetical protein